MNKAELEARQRARREVTIDTVRDVMCFENPSLTPHEAAWLLWKRYPQYPYEAFLTSALLVAHAKELAKQQSGQGLN